MGQEFGLDDQPGVFPLSDHFAEMGGIPVNDDGGQQQVEPGHAVVLALARAVADFALASDPEGVLERVMSLALVQAGVGPALHISVEQPFDDEERSFDPSEAKAVGIAKDRPPPDEEQLSRVAAVSQSRPRQMQTPRQDMLEPSAGQMYQWITGDRLQMTRIQELLAACGCAVSYPSLRRFVVRPQ